MLPRKFNSVMGNVNRDWAASALGMQVNPQKGPDLIDDTKFVEIKFKLLVEGKYSHRCWRVLDYQRDYENNGKVGYWGLGFYTLDKPVSAVRTTNPFRLEDMVQSRELYVVQWDWMNQFPVYHEVGRTEISQWDNRLIFPKFSRVPKVVKSVECEKGVVHFTKGVDSNVFDVLQVVSAA